MRASNKIVNFLSVFSVNSVVVKFLIRGGSKISVHVLQIIFSQFVRYLSTLFGLIKIKSIKIGPICHMGNI